MANSLELSPHALLLDKDPQPCLLIGNDGSIQGMNTACAKMAKDGDLPDWLPANYAHLAKACVTQDRAVADVEVQAPAGQYMLWVFIPLPGKALVLLRGQNATERLRREHDAAVASRLYRLIIENTTDLISRHTPDGLFLDASPASWTLLGYWPEQLRGTSIRALLHPMESERSQAFFIEELEQQGYLTTTYRIRHQQGHYLWFETASRAIRDTYTGSVVEVISVSRDITARIRSEDSNRKLQDELAHAARVATLGELASGIAHEINQPLGAIMNYASASQRYLASDTEGDRLKVQHGLEQITSQADHASKVIKRLRAYLRKGPRKLQRVNPVPLVREAVRLCAWEASEHQVHIREEIAEELPQVYVDPILFEQVMLNLLRNAIEANREVHPDTPSAITLRVSATPQQIDIEVMDQGPGATSERLENMFAPFYTSKPDGLGLGLSMSRGIVDGFGGGLDASPGATGLRLHCWLPAATGGT